MEFWEAKDRVFKVNDRAGGSPGFGISQRTWGIWRWGSDASRQAGGHDQILACDQAAGTGLLICSAWQRGKILLRQQREAVAAIQARPEAEPVRGETRSPPPAREQGTIIPV
jgi:hypothetical protein